MNDPLTPPDCDLRGLAFMPLDVVRLIDSDLMALATGEEFKAAVTLWCKAWLQVPAASLPDDDRILAHLSGTGTRWKRLREMALRGFVPCSDGRLYHTVIAEKACDAWKHRQKQRDKANRRWGNAAAQEPGNAAASAAAMQGRGRGTVVTTDKKSVVTAQRANRLPGDFEVPAEWIVWAVSERGLSRDQASEEGRKFCDYWHDKSGRDATKLDWEATWRNWCRNTRQSPTNGYGLGHSGLPI